MSDKKNIEGDIDVLKWRYTILTRLYKGATFSLKYNVWKIKQTNSQSCLKVLRMWSITFNDC